MNEKLEISLRLKEFIEKNFSGNAASLAREMGIANQDLEKYTSGKTLLGVKQLLRIANLKVACDINYLLTGRSFVNSYSNSVSEPKPQYSSETIELMTALEKIIDNKNKSLEQRLNALEKQNDSLNEIVNQLKSGIEILIAQNISKDEMIQKLSVLVATADNLLKKNFVAGT